MRESVRKTLDNPLLDSHLKSWFAIFLIDIEIKADKKRYIQTQSHNQAHHSCVFCLV